MDVWPGVPVLLLDEPCQSFAWETYQRFWDLAAALRDTGHSFSCCPT